jgi:hypothetical protein
MTQRFPKEINIEVLKGLPGKDIISYCNSSPQFRVICSDDTRYNNLWRKKIKDEFREVYNGPLPFTQYKYLSKLSHQYFYALMYTDENEHETYLLGIYDTYDKAVTAATKIILEQFSYNEKHVSPDSIRYFFSMVDVFEGRQFTLQINLVMLGKVKDDAEDFYQRREQLYMDLFGESSGGASRILNNPILEDRNLLPNKEGKQSKAEEFFEILSNMISELPDVTNQDLVDRLNNELGYIEKKLDKQIDQIIQKYVQKYDKFNLNKKQTEILHRYLRDVAFIPEPLENEGSEENEENEENEGSEENEENEGSDESEE